MAVSVEAKRALLAARLLKAAAATAPPPLSCGQQRLWFLDQLEPGSALYNIPTLARLNGELNTGALEQALNSLVMRHEVLRTSFEQREEEPVQVTQKQMGITLNKVDLSALPESSRWAEADRLSRLEANRPFDLSAGPLLRATLIGLNSTQHLLLLVFHHIVADEWSLHIFFRELKAFYEAALVRGRAKLPDLPIQYADYALWQQKWLRGDASKQQLHYWSEQLAGNPPMLELRGDHPRLPGVGFRGAQVARVLKQAATSRLHALAQQHNATLFMLLLAAFKALLYRYTGQEDLIVASPIAGRNRLETEGLLGFFVNTLLLRTKAAGELRFMDLLTRVRAVTLSAYAHQDLPFEKLVEHLHPARTLSHLPFTRVMFVLQNDVLETMKLGPVSAEFLPIATDTAKFDLTLALQVTREGLVARAEYNSGIFEGPSMERLLEHFEILLEGILAAPDSPISGLPLLSSRERYQLLVEWNDTTVSFPREKCLHELFEAQAARAPESPALMFGAASLSYGELNARANQLAHCLKRHQVGPDVPVAIALEPGAEMVIGMLAVLKAGGAYVPLDVRNPKERLGFMLEDTRSPVLLAQQKSFAHLPPHTAHVICLDADWELIARESRSNLPNGASSENLAYVMFTSGSTGRPKGVAVPHRAVARLVLNTNYIRLDASSRVAQVSNVSFDAATFEIWGALLNGGQLIGISPELMLSPSSFARELRHRGITAMFLTTAVFNQVAAEAPDAFADLQDLLVGGEALDPKWIRAVLRARPPARLVNGYGPTENTTFTCCFEIRDLPEGAATVPIGRPLSNTQVYILDKHQNPVPLGVPGELYAGGDGLARGYWNRPELTAEKFIPNPFAADLGGALPKLYKTGDLARYRPDGTIEYLGRIDQQVKMRGFRIELGEIESVLGAHPGIRECAVRVQGNGSSSRRLLAYFVASSKPAPPPADLRRFLSEKLPDYMVPAAFIGLESLPLNANGKLDSEALPAFDGLRPELDRQYVAPRTDLERQLAGIWENVLGISPIGVQDRFFELGGHSLLAVKVIAKIEKATGKKLRLASLFQAPTIEQLAAVLQSGASAGVPGNSSLVEIQSQGRRTPLFLVHGAGGGMFWGYVNLSRHLGPQQPVYGFKSRGLEGVEEFARIEDIAAQYVADMRRIHPHGPYQLGGYCFGGVVAFEMARQLAAQQEEVALLALFNCAPPNSRYTRIPWTPRWGWRLLRNLLYWANYFRQWSPTQRLEFFRWKWSLLRKRLSRMCAREAGNMSRVDAGDLVDLSSYSGEQRSTWEAHIRALLDFHPQPFQGKVELFRSPGHPLWCSFEPDYGWSELARGGVQVTIVPGAHEKILEDPCVEILAKHLAAKLQQIPLHAPRALTDAPGPETRAGRNGQQYPQNAPPENPMPAASVPEQPCCSSFAGFKEPQAVSSCLQGAREEFHISGSYAEHFAAKADHFSSGVAVTSAEQQLNYAELNSRANRLAHCLKEMGVGPEALVGVCLERSLDLAVALLAIWKAGGALLPLDPDYPLHRLAYMLHDSQAQLVLTQERLRQLLPDTPARVVCLDAPEMKSAVERCPGASPSNAATADNLAYVIYTSGSTGEPKGVAVTHRALLNHNLAVAQAYQLQPVDRVLQFTPLSFDISLEEIFPTWLSGATVVLRNDEAVFSPARFLKYIERERITVLNLPTAYWHELVECLHSGEGNLPLRIRLVIIGGERALETDFRKWEEAGQGSVALVNAYGATEAAITSTLYTARGSEDSLPIGRPLPNVQAVILTERLEPVPEGAEGELFIGGAGLARGYLNRPELTAERFIRNPFPLEIKSDRLYRTGDLARLNPEGDIEFLGRLDEQVKIRGYRIELGEIEAVLLTHPSLKEAVVLAREDAPGNKRLVAYFVAREAGSVSSQKLRGFLKEKLPPYMVPSVFIPLPALPLTPAGKVDRRALPAPAKTRPELAREFVAPQTPVEQVLANIWSELLGISPVGIHDNLFDLGAHSLLGLQAISRIRQFLELEITLEHLFAKPTIAEFAADLARAGASVPVVLPASAIPSGARALPLSVCQKRLWLLEQLHQPYAPYNRTLGVRLRGPLDVGVLRQSFRELARRHEGLRAVFPVWTGAPVQYICSVEEICLPVFDLSALPEAGREQAAMKRLEEEARHSHILAWPVLRPALFKLRDEEHWLLLLLHEIAADARSLSHILDELTGLYEAGLSGKPVQLAQPEITYPELVSLNPLGPSAEADWLYWKKQLEGAPTFLDLPADRPRPNERSCEGSRVPVTIAEPLAAAIEAAARAQNCSVFTTLFAGFAALLHRYTGAGDFVVGSSVCNQAEARFQHVLGNFENPLALRCDLSGNPTFQQLLARLSETVAGALAHSRLPFTEIVDRLGPERDSSYSRVFQTSFLLDAPLKPEQRAGGVTFAPFEVNNHTCKMSLVFFLTRTPSGFSGWCEYNTALFNQDRIVRLVQHYLTLLEGALSDPGQKISLLPLLTPAERALIDSWNRTESDYPRDKTLADLFVEQVRRTPGAEAVVCGPARLTYQQLCDRAMARASDLRRLGLAQGGLVGICLGRSEELLISILGTLLAGGAYVPLDPAYPAERLAFILQDAKVSFVLTETSLKHHLPATSAQVIEVNTLACASSLSRAQQLRAAPQASDLAYVIFTSGSTGRPKGVALEHRGAVALVSWAKGVFTPEELSGVLACTSVCFDLSVFEMFVPLCLGGKVILAENALALAHLPASPEVTLINTVPSALRELLRLKAVPDSVRVVNLAGEPLEPALVDQIYQHTCVKKVYDLYGPTETTTYSTFALRLPGQPATIGRPLANEEVVLLDQNLQPVPIGIPGELFIGGIGLAREYLNRPELTAERFVSHPLKPGARLYRTGDLARWRADGNLEYLGRLDHQVKVRGFRIELGEIEAVLRQHAFVREAVVLAREDTPGDRRLVAYLTGAAEKRISAEDLRTFVRLSLPEHMVPSNFVWLERLPLTPNGKLDRKALPPPGHERVSATDITAPRTPLEEQVRTIWAEVLGLDSLSVHDNFFELGGHSLLATQVISRLREAFDVQVPLLAFVASPTIASLAEGISTGRWTKDHAALAPSPVPKNGNHPVSFVQERLWFLAQLEPASSAYNIPAALRLEGPLQLQALQGALDQLLARHDALRTTFTYSDGNLAQVIAPALTVKILEEDFHPLPAEAREKGAREWINAEARQPFDLERGPLLRARLARLGAGEHLFLVVFHHTIADGWSLANFFQELQLCYDAVVTGAAPSLPLLSLQYADFAHWQRRSMQGAVLDRELTYWKETLRGAPATLRLPSDFQPEHPDGKAGRCSAVIPAKLETSLAELARRESCTNFTILITALALTLYKWSGQEDLVIGTVVAGRTRREFEHLFGCFMNFLPLRMRMGPQETGRATLVRSKTIVLEGQAHQECPFERIVEAVNPQRELNRNPLYNVALLLQNFPPELFRSQSLRAARLPVPLDSALLDLRFEVEPCPGGFSVECEYRTDLFAPKTIEELLASYLQALEFLTGHPETPILEYHVTQGLQKQAQAAGPLDATETLAIAATFTAEPLAGPLRYWLSELEIPGRVHFAPYNQVFQELLSPASLLGANARGLNVLLLRLEDWERPMGAHSAGSPEPIEQHLRQNTQEFLAALKTAVDRGGAPYLVCFCPASARLLADPLRGGLLVREENALLAELSKLGGVYLLPSSELARYYPVADYDDPSAQELGHIPYTDLFFTALATAIARKFHALRRPPVKAIVLDCDQTLWSGVCGEDGPHGLRLEPGRRALQEFMRAQLDAGRLLCLCSKNNEEDVLAVFSQRADMPLRLENFSARRLNWLPKSENLKSLAAELNLGLESLVLVDDNPVECADVQANCPGVAALQLPAEPERLPRFLRHCWVLDHLKITEEDRRRAAFYRQNRQREQLRAQASTLADFLSSLNLQVRIETMTPGQVPRVSQLTQRTNQFNCSTLRLTEPEVQAKLAHAQILTVTVSDRFGDYGLAGAMLCRLSKATLEVDAFLLSCRVLGRGIEHRMLAYLGQLACERGAAWVGVHFVRSARNQPALDFLEAVGARFRQALNGGYVFLFPAQFARDVVFNPEKTAPDRTPDGQLSQAAPKPPAPLKPFTRYNAIALEADEVSKIHSALGNKETVLRSARTGSYQPPRDDTERQLCVLWQNLLRIQRVGIKDDFFELGGHSLLAVRLFTEIEKLVGRKLPLVTIFQAPTVEQLARALVEHQSSASGSLLVPIRPQGSKQPLFLVHGAGGDVLWGYANLAAYLPPDRPIYGIKSRGQAGLHEPASLREMAGMYLNAVRAFQPKGPYFLGGYCFGGNVAYEMARQLEAQGESAALVALLDAAPSNVGYEQVSWWRPEFPWRFARNFRHWWKDFRALSATERRRFIARKTRWLGRKLNRQLLHRRGPAQVDLEEVIDPAHFPENELKLWKIHLQLLVGHVDQAYAGQITLLRTAGQPLFCSLEEDFCWGKLVRGGVLIRHIPGSHENIFMEPNVQALARELVFALETAGAGQPKSL